MCNGAMMKCTVLAAIVCAVVAACRLDWILVGVELVLLVALSYPDRKSGCCFHHTLLKTAFAVSAVLIVFSLVMVSGVADDYYIGGVHWVYVIECFIVPVLSFDAGFMFAIILDRYTQSQFSKRWMIVFAMVFAFAVAGVSMFTVGFSLWYTDNAFYNENINGGHFTSDIYVADRILMASPSCAVITGLICAVVAKLLTRGVDKATFLCGVKA